ncbi:hypothetical protein P152DRAFT_69456 [Eremomyces bilateralis CBS 781.70]|uniref:Transcriptional regulatory protein DEP1 n=1 Tax=Eremomyces bilateralis CBS 781.70 TaxID=1392243 RepID=A0A6G1FZV4_9PEZI|nr:uncharacterized protein P152DRAFT_69456 [Eremomyces bilateralis CBS 781.70]KAF1811323.1 hypothetical protein P152DRAFT_69456 [Eremomyces bilateralis CBS 781.70]
MASQEQPGLADLKSAAVDTSPEQWESMDDDRSSSLSEPEDPTEERDIVVPDEVEEESASDAENDTEAETERLDISPQKWLKVQVEEVDEDKAKEDAEAQIDEMEQDQEDVDAASTGTHTREPTPDILKATEPETMPRKRKRAAGLTDPLMTGEDPDEPAAKRSHSSQEESIADPEEEREPEEPDPDENVDEEIAEQLVEELAAQAQPELEPEVEVEEKEDAVIEQEEPEKPSRALRFRKGKRKGKKVKDPELDRASGTPRLGPVEGEDVVEEEADEEDPNAIQEEEALTKRKFALDMLGEVERQFIAFKERHLNEQINHINKELELLNEPDCQHSEYLAMLQCIDERRTNKVQHEHIHKRYRMQTLRIKVVGERSQLQSQLLQDLRVAREKALEDGYKYFHALQRDRRRFGADDTNYMHMFPTKRSTQVEQQTAYNLEVSILSGIAKHVGFPAAPDMKGLDDAEIESDLQAMKVC